MCVREREREREGERERENMKKTRDMSMCSAIACGTMERWGAGVEYHFQEFNEPYAPS